MPFTLEELKDEIVNDPLALGYKNSATPNDWKGDQEIVDLISFINYTADREKISQADVRSAVPFDEYDGLTIDKQEWLRWLTPADGDLIVTADAKLQLTNTLSGNGIWANADTDAPLAIKALIEYQASRAEVLWGEFTVITPGNVGAAFNLL